MNHYVYKITDLTNGYEYIGVRQCLCDPSEDIYYYGSGVLISEEIKEHGRSFFHKEIIEIFDSRDKALNAEKTIVNKEYVSRHDTYNVTIGGMSSRFARKKGMDSPSSGTKHTALSLEKMSKAKKGKSGKKCHNYRGQYICGDEGEFQSIYLASLAVNVSPSTITNRCKSKRSEWVDWYFVAKGGRRKPRKERFNECNFFYKVNGKCYPTIKVASVEEGIPERTIYGYISIGKKGFEKVINEQR